MLFNKRTPAFLVEFHPGCFSYPLTMSPARKSPAPFLTAGGRGASGVADLDRSWASFRHRLMCTRSLALVLMQKDKEYQRTEAVLLVQKGGWGGLCSRSIRVCPGCYGPEGFCSVTLVSWRTGPRGQCCPVHAQERDPQFQPPISPTAF